jgi:hypothetical protein
MDGSLADHAPDGRVLHTRWAYLASDMTEVDRCHLASSDPCSVLSVIQLSQASYRGMKQIRWWAAGYDLLSAS